MNVDRDEPGSPTTGGGGSTSWTQASRPFVIAVASAALVVVSYEIAERMWLQNLEVERVLFLHGVRNLLVAIVAATLTAWLILRESPPLLSDADLADPRAAGSPLTEAERVAHFADWFIRMRWLAIIVASLLVLFAVRIVGLLPQRVWWPLMITIGVLAILNALYTTRLHSTRATAYLLPVQTYGDLVVLTVLLHYSGGVENPLSTLLLFHVIIAGIILPRRRCYVVAAAASVLFGSLVWAEWAHLIDHYTLRIFPHYLEAGVPTHAAHSVTYALSGVAVQTAILFLTAFFTTTVTDRLRRHERELAVYTDRLRAQSQLLEQALETTNTGLSVYDRDLQTTWTNKRWLTWFGPQPGRGGAAAATTAGDAPGSMTLEDGVVRVTEVALGEVEGDPPAQRIFQLTTAPLFDQDGIATHVVHLGHEITEQKRIQAGMMHTAKLAAVGELAGKVAHEVNNPIAIISAKARLLLADSEERLPPKTADELAKITDLADRVARIAQGLLSYCRPATGPAAPLDLRVPIRKALAAIETPAATAGVQIAEYLRDPLPDVWANAGEMEQVFLNLFLNSLDAMPRGGTLSVTAGVDDDGRCSAKPGLLILVEDTGCGVPDEIRDRVFEPFVTTKESGRGTGLGLSICLGLVRSNGGQIDLESEPAGGTIVRLRFADRGAITVQPADD